MSSFPHHDESSQALQKLNLTLSAGGIAASALLVGPAFTAAYALGAALEAVNFRALCACASRMLSGQLADSRGWLVLLGMRLTLLFAAMGVALLAGAHPIGLLLGVSTVVPAVLIGAWWLAPPIDPNAPALPADDPAWDHWSVWRADVVEPDDEEAA
ncbi:MAG TPA: hypothetical protein VLC53_15860 [Myxococcota bacterium]|nr:hypothetical protein [Myxococcota bacterium]